MTGLSELAINPEAKIRVETIASGCPILVIDDFYAQPMAVRELALRGGYDASLAYYPGVHSAIDPHKLWPLFQSLSGILAALGSGQADPADFDSDFSLVTTPASDMLANQKHPHVDAVPLAGVLYLNPDYEVGTSFFRHRPLGLAFLRDEHEYEAYNAWLSTEGERTQPKTYAVGNDETWEHIYTTAGKFNRLVMYPGIAFHSIAMQDVARHLSLSSARLTQRFFVKHFSAAGR
jgi:hypothetical protein